MAVGSCMYATFSEELHVRLVAWLQLTTANKEAADAQEALSAMRAISTGSSGGVAVRVS